MKTILRICVLAALGANAVWAGSPLRVPVHFAITNDAGLGYEWYVVGSHPDVGAWDPAQAIKLAWSTGNVWWGDVGVQAGTALEYKFVKRSTAPGDVCDSGNGDWWPGGANLQTNVPAEPAAPFSGKRIEFYSDLTNVSLFYSVLSAAEFGATGTWHSVGMTRVGPGLRAGEGRHVAEGVGTEGEWLRFTFNGWRNGTNVWEGAWDGQDYWTPLDALIVRDRQVFNYLPPSNGVSDSRIVTNYVGSTAPHVTGRWVRVYLPRGYAENANRRYPVVYMSDGENVFQPGGTYGCWNADTTADAEIRGGRMRESIIVGVPSAANRQTEYLPHMDTDPDRPPGTVGRANYYADYLVHNVRPMVDYGYRTKNDRANTACIGSSSGGLLATYLGTWTNVFGLVGAMSGVYSADFCPNFRSWLESAQPHDARFWMDVGTVGGELNIGGISLYYDNYDLYWYLTSFGYVPNADLRFMIGCGHDHNEWAWSQRLPRVYRFLLDVREEPNPLVAPELEAAGAGGEISFPVFEGTAYAVEWTDNLTNGWTAATNWARETRPWSNRTVNLPALKPAGGYFRVRGD
ncbi:MAG TPA: alpha/beta hydrolase-fold protein [Kiritimatiellia bacterium]|nr:alpha/beta hydrolase-fold protein [Kiritimatiellia bacterium]